MQSTSFERSSQRVKPGFGSAVALVLENEQGLIEERLLGFSLSYTMLVDALARVPRVPIEADNARPIDHVVYWRDIRSRQDRAACRLLRPVSASARVSVTIRL
jgi:hypothetical protein